LIVVMHNISRVSVCGGTAVGGACAGVTELLRTLSYSPQNLENSKCEGVMMILQATQGKSRTVGSATPTNMQQYQCMPDSTHES
jgi:hypothetical protein